MTEQVINLNNDNFESFASLALRKLGKDEIFSDVTLVSKEGEGIKAHKVILASFSKMLAKILVMNEHSNPVIYMNKIDFSTLHMLKSFKYYGYATVPTNTVHDFIRIIGVLRIEGLVEQIAYDQN